LDSSSSRFFTKSRVSAWSEARFQNPRMPWAAAAQLTSDPVAASTADICVDRIWTISKSRLGERVGELTPGEVAALRGLLTEMYGEP